MNLMIVEHICRFWCFSHGDMSRNCERVWKFVCLSFELSHVFRWLMIIFTAIRAKTCVSWLHI